MIARTVTAPNSRNIRPVSTELVSAQVRGEVGNRLMIILRAPGCTYDLRPSGGCTYCNFRSLTTHGEPVTGKDLVAQVNHSLSSIDCYQENILELDLYSSGNFLNDAEVPAEARIAIMQRCALEKNLRVVLVESRPEYITGRRITEMLQSIGGPLPFALEVAIGLESADDIIREKDLKKGFTRKAFERAVRVLGETGVDLLTYVMLKPRPMSDEQALCDVQRTSEYVYDVASRAGVRARVALQATFVVPGTALAKEYLEGQYQPPSLWLTMEAVKIIAPLGDLSVALWDEGLDPLAIPNSCASCRALVLDAMRRFNLTQDIGVLNIPLCSCARASTSTSIRMVYGVAVDSYISLTPPA